MKKFKNLPQELLGETLYGDDFTINQIEEWYNDEKEGYANLGSKIRENYSYEYHEWNKILGFNFLKNLKFEHTLGIGSAYGDEFLPIVENIEKIKILEPSEAFNKQKRIKNTPCEYVKPSVNGKINFDDNTFDLIICFGVLHHIPNVSYVMSELNRVLKSGGYFLIREPIVSMGNWNLPRKGLTKNERGIPLNVFRKIVSKTKFKIEKETLCNFALIPKIAKTLGIVPYNNKIISKIDILLSQMFSWNYQYHTDSTFKKLRPSSIFYILSK